MPLTLSPVATDSFTGTDGTALESHGAGNWALLISSTAGYTGINTNQLRPLFGNTIRSVHRWAGAGTIGNDQYSQITIVAIGGDNAAKETGLIVRASADTNGAADYYEWYFVGNSPRLTVMRKVVNGVATTLETITTVPWADGDVMAFAVVGTTLYGLRNGTVVTTVTGQTDLTTGKPGIAMRGVTGGSLGVVQDSWVGGTAAEATDTTAPILTSPTGTSTGTTTATVGATTDEGDGTMYAVVTAGATQPSIAQIKAGQDSGGLAAAWSGSQAVSSAGAKTFSATGLTAATTYYVHVVHTDAAANDSNLVSSASFTTSSAGDTTPPTLSSPVGTGGTGTCGGSVSTNEANGTLYTVFTASATAPTAVQVEAGQDNTGAAALRAVSQSVSATGSQAVASGGITAGTRYAHFMHKDGAGNRSTVASSASFTVTSGATYSLSLGPFVLNTGSGPLLSTTLSYTLWPGVDAGVVSGTPINGTGTTHATTGVLSITGLAAAGSYMVCLKNSDGSGRWHNVATAT